VETISSVIEIPVQNFKEWLEKESSSFAEPIRNEAVKYLNEIKGHLEEARKACENFANESEREMQKGKSYRRTRASRKLAQFFIKSIDSVSIPSQVSYVNLQAFQEELGKMLFVVGRERAVWFPRISPLFIMVRRKIDIAFKNVADSLEKFRSFLSVKCSKLKALEDSFQTVDEIVKGFDLLNETERIIRETTAALDLLTKEMAEKEVKLSSLRESREMTSLIEVNKQMEELEKKIQHELRHLQKPFVKLQSLARNAEISLLPDENQKLDEYLRNPFVALASEEENYPILKRILAHLNNAMSQKKLKLKASRLKKAEEQINDLVNKNTLAPLQKSCIQILRQKQQLLTSNTIATFQNEIQKLEKDLIEMRRQKELMESRKTSLEREIRESREKIEKQKRTLEETVFNVLGRKILLTFPTSGK